MITVLMMTDGRKEYFAKTYDSLWNNVSKFDNILIHDDSGDPEYREWLMSLYNTHNTTIYSTPARSGFGGAVRSAWDQLRNTDTEWVFHLEEDFTFNRPLDLLDIQKVLETRPQIVQMALRRQPWNDAEREAGGVVESNPEAYTDRTDGEHEWLEHSAFFTTNVSLYRRSLIDNYEWPLEDHSEGLFSIKLFENKELRSGYWGSRDSGEWIEHIGEHRSGTGY